MGLIRAYRLFGPIPGKNEALICGMRTDLTRPKGKGRGVLALGRRILLGGGVSGPPPRGLDQAGSGPAGGLQYRG